MEKFFLIANPVSGTGRAKKDWNKIAALLKARRIDYEAVFTRRHQHERELTVDAVRNGFRKFISIGGDGTLNQILNGVFNQQIVSPAETCLGVIPAGMGNDWSKTFSIPPDYVPAVEIIKAQKLFLHDVGVIECINNNSQVKHFFINIAGLGFDAFVVKNMTEARGENSGGRFSYYSGILKYLFNYKPVEMKLTAEENIIEEKLFSAVVAVCKFNGGGMMQAPFAIPDDGMLDVTVFSNISRAQILADLLLLKSGAFVKKNYVKIFKKKKISADASGNSFAEADGEYLGTAPARFMILPKAVSMIVK